MLTNRHHDAAEVARRLLNQLFEESLPETRLALFRAARKVMNRDPIEPRFHDRAD
ncbi:MAG: hypothetical protein IM658_05505 [Phenylobacterium sp.]|jgi:hypothetical protein|uniref:hypothetical protein n=1 Tax=Phenylobacterium sp. TaxID=1871053 RepID=UPI0025CDB901|nr:hypothetical protein [Phenylobacterium sp.]MCA3712709.1 hypothetical protein [Phenylobacterium sp.]MCA3747034.1 hypothetical protein [Phenylobacterium sp.]MCA3751322.1 hypothetical protein [Phenylobacterium sp.]MCA6238225.1 hypothetical protein [Phenylobacterium sp.]MCA6241956.1 hypothetical protein [Phenylobacterium sp.]